MLLETKLNETGCYNINPYHHSYMSICVSNKMCFRHTQEYIQLKQARQAVQRHIICILDANHGYILDGIVRSGHT